jgi:phenylalanyl-tRNA synthetase beta chain
VGLGLQEVITYSLIDPDLWKRFKRGQDPEAIEILNPLSKEQEILRPSLIPSLCQGVAYNFKQKQDYIRIFEIAQAFSRIDNTAKEELALGIVLSGARSLLLQQGLIKDEIGLLHLKGTVETIFERLGIRDYNFTMENAHQVTVYADKELVGRMSVLKKEILDYLDIKNREVFTLELSLERFFNLVKQDRQFRALPKYPGITRDISLVLKEDLAINEVLRAMQEKGKPWLREVDIVDYYKGRQIPSGYKGLTVSCLYRADERTLTDEEIAPLHALICGLLSEQFSAKIR